MSIRSEIETKLITYAKEKGIPVAGENMAFTKPTTGTWLEVVFLDKMSINRNVAAAGKRVTGMFQINCYAKVGTGMGAVEALADDVTNLYPVVPKLGLVSIEAPLSASNVIVIDAFICVPVTGRYRAEF